MHRPHLERRGFSVRCGEHPAATVHAVSAADAARSYARRNDLLPEDEIVVRDPHGQAEVDYLRGWLKEFSREGG